MENKNVVISEKEKREKMRNQIKEMRMNNTVTELKRRAYQLGLTGYTKKSKDRLIIMILEEEARKGQSENSVEDIKEAVMSDRKSMVMLKENRRTFRYKYLLLILANQLGMNLAINDDKTVSAKGTDEQIVQLAGEFGTYIDFINKTRISVWRKAKNEGKLVPNLERSLILGMLDAIKHSRDYKIGNEQYSRTISPNIKQDEVVLEWYNLGKELIENR